MTELRIIEIFDSLQGEGCWTGAPMTFVRLSGCNTTEQGLLCARWCDTRYAWEQDAGTDMGISEVLRRVHLPRLCVTGGEPLLQAEGVVRLVNAAHDRGIRVHLETNGTLDPPRMGGIKRSLGTRPHRAPDEIVRGWRSLREGSGVPSARDGAGFGGFDWSVISPKPPDYTIAPGWQGLIDELKFVADCLLDAATVERIAALHSDAIVCIQPEYLARSENEISGRQESVRRAISMVMSHPDWRLSWQTQKLVGFR